MLTHRPAPKPRLILGGGGLAIAGAAVLAATVPVMGTAAPPTTSQAATIGVKPDGADGYTLIVAGAAVAPGAALPGGETLPPDFSGAGGCNLKLSAKPFAMVLKGAGGDASYTVMCASAAPAPVRATLAEGLTSLRGLRASVATQRTPRFPEAERRHALGAVDRSIGEIEGALAATS